MIKIYVDDEEQKERLINPLDDSYTCPFLEYVPGCFTGRVCRECIKENIEFRVTSSRRK